MKISVLIKKKISLSSKWQSASPECQLTSVRRCSILLYTCMKTHVCYSSCDKEGTNLKILKTSVRKNFKMLTSSLVVKLSRHHEGSTTHALILLSAGPSHTCRYWRESIVNAHTMSCSSVQQFLHTQYIHNKNNCMTYNVHIHCHCNKI